MNQLTQLKQFSQALDNIKRKKKWSIIDERLLNLVDEFSGGGLFRDQEMSRKLREQRLGSGEQFLKEVESKAETPKGKRSSKVSIGRKKRRRSIFSRNSSKANYP